MSAMRDVRAEAKAKFPVGTKVRHKETGVVGVVGEYRTRKDGRVVFEVFTDGGNPTTTQVRAGRLLAEYEVI